MFITHKLNETMAVSDQVTVIRKGKVVFKTATKDTTPEELATQMVGRQVESVVSRHGNAGGGGLELKGVRLAGRRPRTWSTCR